MSSAKVLSDAIGEVECCISRTQALGLMAEGLLRLDRRYGNAMAMASDDLEQHLIGIRDRLCEVTADGRAEA